MAKYICSKLACDNAYTVWEEAGKTGNDLPKKRSVVLIKGGAGVADKRVITPYGVVTEISDQQLEMLQRDCPQFSRHLKRGFLKILNKNPSESEVKKIADDQGEDKSAPLTPSKLKSEGKKKAELSK